MSEPGFRRRSPRRLGPGTSVLNPVTPAPQLDSGIPVPDFELPEVASRVLPVLITEAFSLPRRSRVMTKGVDIFVTRGSVAQFA